MMFLYLSSCLSSIAATSTILYNYVCLPDYPVSLSVMARFKTALFFLTFGTGSLLADEKEGDMDTRCISLE